MECLQRIITEKTEICCVQLRPDNRFIDRVQFLSSKRLWIENYTSARSLLHEWRTQLSSSKPDVILKLYSYKRAKASWGVSGQLSTAVRVSARPGSLLLVCICADGHLYRQQAALPCHHVITPHKKILFVNSSNSTPLVLWSRLQLLISVGRK